MKRISQPISITQKILWRIGDKLESFDFLYHLPILICVLCCHLLPGVTLWSSHSVNLYTSGPLQVLFLLWWHQFARLSGKVQLFFFLRLSSTIQLLPFLRSFSWHTFLICCPHIFSLEQNYVLSQFLFSELLQGETLSICLSSVPFKWLNSQCLLNE